MQTNSNVECESEYLTRCGEQRILPAVIPEKRGNEKSDIPIPIYANIMGNLTTNNERSTLPISGEFRGICFCFTAEALEWLSGTTNTPNTDSDL